jgi:hypothetical protein
MTAAFQVSLLALPWRDQGDGSMNPLACPGIDRQTTRSTPLPAIHRQAEERLRQSSYLALQDVRCIACDDVVYLDGCLPSYYLKQVAQEIASGVAGVRRLINRIEVLGPTCRPRPRQERFAGEPV